jgi:hypothetical protein
VAVHPKICKCRLAACQRVGFFSRPIVSCGGDAVSDAPERRLQGANGATGSEKKFLLVEQMEEERA